ncbi:unnamed protein product, partial [Rotaria sp. Silwood2]
MPQKSTRIIIDRDLESCKRCLMVHDLDETIKESDIKRMIAQKLETNTIKFQTKLHEPN